MNIHQFNLNSFYIEVKDIPYWIVMHFTRHKFGIEHWISTQRDDKTGEDRNKKPQDAPVRWRFLVNAQEVLFISRRRLCKCAHPETRKAWQRILNAIKPHDEALYSACVPDCIYRGHCYEYKSCGFHKTAEFATQLEVYRSGINE